MAKTLTMQYGVDGRMGSYLYLFICVEDGKFIVKLGVSDFPSERLQAIRLGCPFKAKTFATMRTPTRKAAFKIEREMLKRMKQWRTRGEWMRFTPDEKGAFNEAIAEVTASLKSSAYPMKWDQVSMVEIEKGMQLRKSLGRKSDYPSFRDFQTSTKGLAGADKE